MSEVKSILTGNIAFPITQDYGVNSPDIPDWWYDYARDGGLEAGQHPGLDIGTPLGTPVFAVADGTVTGAVDAPSVDPFFRPNPVYQTAQDGTQIIYGHMWDNVVDAGDKVTKGQYLGTSGEQTVKGTRTPDGSGPHIHFEVRDPAGQFINPLDYLNGTTGDPGDIPGGDGSNGDGGQSGSLSGIVSKLGVSVAGIAVLAVGIVLLVSMARSK